MRHLRLIPVLFICLLLTGGHHGVLQCVAWAGMLWTYSEEDGWLQGAQDTFSGDKPCELCDALADAREGESDPQEPMAANSLSKLKDLQCPQQVWLNPPVGAELPPHSHPQSDRIQASLHEAPLPPPPRA